MDGVRQWCAAHNLSQYADRIIDEGYDTLQELCEIEEDDLEACGVRKRAHTHTHNRDRDREDREREIRRPLPLQSTTTLPTVADTT